MDWKTILADLHEAGYSQTMIALLCGCSQPAINELASGKTGEPKYSLGERIKEVHAQAMSDKQARA